MLKKIRKAVHDAALDNQKMSMFHYQVLRNAAALDGVNPETFCREIGVPTSYKTEFTKMLGLARVKMQQDSSALSDLNITQLLNTHSAVLEELRHREVLRTNNNPTGDYAEWLVSESLGLTLAPSSAAGYDATDEDGIRYQIKGRNVRPEDKSFQLGVIRNLEGKEFDFLVAVIFETTWGVRYAAKIARKNIHKFGQHNEHQNGHIVTLQPAHFGNSCIEDISELLKKQIQLAACRT